MQGWLGWLVIAGCWTSEARLDQTEQQVQVEMGAHAHSAATLRDALISGQLEAARVAARGEATRPPVEGLPESQQVWERAVDKAAQRIAEAGDLTTAASALGDMAEACASCHQLAAQGPPPRTSAPPPAGEGLASVMARHRELSEGLWSGMIRGDAEELRRAAAALEEHELPGLEGSRAAVELDEGVHRAAEAVAAAAPDARGERYAELVITCAACHLSAGRGGPVGRDR